MTTNARERGATPRWWRIVVGVVLPILVTIACAALLLAALQPIASFVLVIIAGYALVGLGAVWTALAGVRLWRFRPDRRIWIAPTIVVVTVTLAVLGVPGRIGWQLSKGDLARYAEDCPATYGDMRLGVYEVYMVTPRPGGCHFYTEGGLFDAVGVAHLPGGTDDIGDPVQEGDIGYRHLDGDWYRFTEIVF